MKKWKIIGLISLGVVAAMALGVRAFLNSGFVMNSPAEYEVINEVGAPLAIGEHWVEGEQFDLCVTEVTERSWEEEKFAIERYQELKQENYRIFDFCFTYTNLQYHGYYKRGKLIMALGFVVTGVGYDEFGEQIRPVPLGHHESDLFFFHDDEDDILIGMTAEDNHFTVFVKPEAKSIELIFNTFEYEYKYQLEKRYLYQIV